MEINDQIFLFVYNLAMNDATMQQAYNGSKDELVKNCKESKKVLKRYIDDLLSDEENKYNFEKIAIELKRVFKNYPDFKFGNIQKIINMTAKYFYISTYDKTNKDKFKSCDCPMDSIMIKMVLQEYNKAIESDPAQKEKEVEYYINDDKKMKDWSKIAWSKIVDVETQDRTSITIYKKYQEMVKYLADKRGCMPIELDYFLFNQTEEDET